MNFSEGEHDAMRCAYQQLLRHIMVAEYKDACHERQAAITEESSRGNRGFTVKDVAPYIQHLGSYPLPLSAAYPLFSWRVLFREGKFVGIMHADDDFPVLPNDSIVIRKPEMSDIMEAVRSINHQDEDINNEVILFDFNTDNIKRFKSEDYEKIFNHRNDGSSI